LILPGLLIYVGKTAQEAEDYYQELQALLEPDLGIEMDMSRYPIDGPVPELVGDKRSAASSRLPDGGICPS
jgi:hypothetical protein